MMLQRMVLCHIRRIHFLLSKLGVFDIHSPTCGQISEGNEEKNGGPKTSTSHLQEVQSGWRIGEEQDGVVRFLMEHCHCGEVEIA